MKTQQQINDEGRELFIALKNATVMYHRAYAAYLAFRLKYRPKV